MSYTIFRSKGYDMVVTLCDDEVSDHEPGSDEVRTFIAFTTTAVVNERVVVEENLSDGELSKCADLQEVFNKLCKVATKDAMNVDLGLKKIASLELDKKDLLLKLLDANTLIDKVKIENMLLFEKIKNLELKLYVAREQIDRSASSKLDHMLSVQKSPLDKTGLGFVDSIFVSETHSTYFVSFFEPSKSETVKPVKVTPPPRKIRIDLKDKLHDRPLWVCHFCGKIGHIHPNCFKLEAAKRENKPKVPMPQA